MKYIKSINEYLNPEKQTYIKWLNNSILKEIEKLDMKISYEGNTLSSLSFHIEYLKSNDLKMNIKLIYNIIYKWKKYILEKDNIIMMIYSDIYHDNTIRFNLKYKNLKIKRIKPLRYVYHQTKKSNLNSILEYGLVPKDSSKWTDDDWTLEYPPAIFASNLNDPKKYDLFHYGDNDIITIKIDTTKIKNKWFSDLNLEDYENTIKKKNREEYIMTFDPIPPQALEIIK